MKKEAAEIGECQVSISANLVRPGPAFYTVPELARRYSVSKGTIRRWYCAGRRRCAWRGR